MPGDKHNLDGHGIEIARFVKVSRGGIQTISFLKDGCMISELRYLVATMGEHTDPARRGMEAEIQTLIKSGFEEDL